MRKQMLEFWYFEPLNWNKKKKGNITFNFFFTFPSYFPSPSLISSFRPFSLYHIVFLFHLSLSHLFLYLPPSLSSFLPSFLFHLLSIPFEIIDQSTHSTPFNTLPPQKRIYINRTQFRLCVEIPLRSMQLRLKLQTPYIVIPW